MKEYITHNEEETFLLGIDFSKEIIKGDVVALYGDLGSGKTQLIKGICKGLGVIEEVTSPTFTLMCVYEAKYKIFHFDFYRLSSDSEIYDLGIDDFIFSDSVSLIEWAEKAQRFLPSKRIDIFFDFGNNDNERIIKISRLA